MAEADHAVMVTERMPWSQICIRYPDQYVELIDIEWERPGSWDVASARVSVELDSRDGARDRGIWAAIRRDRTIRHTGAMRTVQTGIRRRDRDGAS